MSEYYVYIMSSESGVLYTDVTNDLARRVFEHKKKIQLINSVNPEWRDLSQDLMDVESRV
jgi:predicted GIY-YIG superfamily endonuclease